MELFEGAEMSAGADSQSRSEPAAKPRISVSVSVEYSIDPKGTAKVKDVKTLKNDGSAPAHLSGVFKQAVNHNVSQMRITDSRSPDKKFAYQIIRGDDHHQVAVAIEVPEGTPFTIEPGTERSLIFEYEMSGATTILASGPEPTVLINNRFGSVTYAYDFAIIEYEIKYHITKFTASVWWQRIFQRPTLAWYPPEMTFREDRTQFHMEYRFSSDAKALKYVHMALMFQPRYWVQWVTAFLLGAASSAVVATAPRWLRLLIYLFGE
jgi:hypothetical protein